MIRRPVVMIVLLASACTSSSVHRPADPGRSASSSAASPRVAAPVAFDPARAKRDVASLVAFGPRETVSPAYTRAAAFVRERFETLGYGTRMQRVTVPAGTNDGIAVAAGASVNVVAEPRAFDATRPFVVVGGHLDTVPDSPGANDNASGIAVLLELARIAAVQPPAVPVVFVAFTAEERRRTGPGSSTYARGSAAYLDSIPR
ncbi:MAG TPA: M28 family peptidase, partial [Actinomycetota bacterium]|nr:M28 family peptidase [Actinomycetota bacterium]